MANLQTSPEQDQQRTGLSAPLTPREIVNKQISIYHYHVTEEDLDRMVVTDQLPPAGENKAHEDADSRLKPDKMTSYDAVEES